MKYREKSPEKEEEFYSKQKIRALFHAPLEIGQQVFIQEQVGKFIATHLKTLKRMYNYDFQFEENPLIQEASVIKKTKTRIKNFRRGCHLRMQCATCVQIQRHRKKNHQEPRRWTSSIGTFQIKFAVIPLRKYNRISEEPYQNIKQYEFPFLVLYQPKIWTMKCLKCFKYGIPFMYKDKLEASALSFCKIISQIVKNVPKIKAEPKKKSQTMKQLIFHQVSQCEACQAGVCFYGANYYISSDSEEENATNIIKVQKVSNFPNVKLQKQSTSVFNLTSVVKKKPKKNRLNYSYRYKDLLKGTGFESD